MNNYISFRSINILILWLFIGIGFSPLYGEEPCGLTSNKADATAATKVRDSMSQNDWLPIHFNAKFYNYFEQNITGKYFGCVRSDGKVFLMTYNASADRLQFAPYDPNIQPQKLSGTKVDDMFQLTFTGKSGEKASLGAIAAGMAYREMLKANGGSGTVKIFGCPGEESGSGKAYMARDGHLFSCQVGCPHHSSEYRQFVCPSPGTVL